MLVCVCVCIESVRGRDWDQGVCGVGACAWCVSDRAGMSTHAVSCRTPCLRMGRVCPYTPCLAPLAPQSLSLHMAHACLHTPCLAPRPHTRVKVCAEACLVVCCVSWGVCVRRMCQGMCRGVTRCVLCQMCACVGQVHAAAAFPFPLGGAPEPGSQEQPEGGGRDGGDMVGYQSHRERG